jgi:hypothetical protein
MVVRCMMLVALTASAAAAWAQQPTPASVRVTPQARALFERDWVLMNWALKFYDVDHDQLLSGAEAEAAADQFRRIADADSDGRVTPHEYSAARAAILARY